ncbi:MULTISPECIES: response regulator transcription factor [unclassified Bradyrhizobium]|uniref:response regulator transcription factor n=1 Tax=unclassified Bradyrhizobium TaxID=2631580 RepID=UPI0020B1858A|nr:MULTISPECIES: response regulator [unclassified Bradyrhizobium]MCP3468219.1 response regulator [Bradyrhizobium sp. CCGUVB23]MCP3477678.1 response regulator [Bradyrhizobium sp. CCGUVB1N3]
MRTSPPTIYVIDDDEQIRTLLRDLCHDAGFEAKLFGSTDKFLAEQLSDGPSCLVLDVRFPGTSPTGLDLQQALANSGVLVPIVFISGYSDIRVSVEAMKRGAVEFLPKPFREQELLDAIRLGLERDRRRMERELVVQEERRRFEKLTVRERDILLLIADGLVAKQIAARLNVSETTVKVRRARMMQKLQLRSPVEVVRLVDNIRPDFATTRQRVVAPNGPAVSRGF